MDAASLVAAADPDPNSHAEDVAHSADLLDRARARAADKHAYKSEELRTEVRRALLEACGKEPYDWQLDVTEALLLGLDTAVIAGTGAGKTMPFVMPLLIDKTKKKKVIIISPLNELELDQARRFKKMGLTAAAVNGDVYNMKLHNDIVANSFQVILTSPEMCLKHELFSSLIRCPEFMRHVLYMVIDEAHCVAQWGESFRTGFSELVTMRSLLGGGRPFLLTSATLAPFMLTDVFAKLEFTSETTYTVNLGNDRPNITPIVHRTKAAQSSLHILEFLVRDVQPNSILPRVIVFFNTRDLAFQAYRYLQECAPDDVASPIDYLHAGRSRNARRRAMQRFRDGQINILCATEAAGMGMDIPDIDMSLQFMAASSLSVWIQRAGRAGRSGQHAFAILLVEPAIFQVKRPRAAPKAVASQPKHDPRSQAPASVQQGENDEGACSGDQVAAATKGRAKSRKGKTVAAAPKGRKKTAGSESQNVRPPDTSEPQSSTTSDVQVGASPADTGVGESRGTKRTAEGEVVVQLVAPSAAETSLATVPKPLEAPTSADAGLVPPVGGVLEYKKKAEDGMRRWAGAETCRRAIADEYFGNPPRPGRTDSPSHPCCDNCVKEKASRGEPLTEPENRVLRIIDSIAGKVDTGREDADMEYDDEGDDAPVEGEDDDALELEAVDRPSTDASHSESIPRRRSDHLLLCRARLVRWRIETWTEKYSYCAFSHLTLLPDKVLTSLATHARLQRISDVKRALPLWPFADAHGAEILRLLADIDLQVQRQKKVAEDAKVAKATEKKEKENEARRAKRQKQRDVWKVDTRWTGSSVTADSSVQQMSSVRWAPVMTGYSAS